MKQEEIAKVVVFRLKNPLPWNQVASFLEVSIDSNGILVKDGRDVGGLIGINAFTIFANEKELIQMAMNFAEMMEQ